MPLALHSSIFERLSFDIQFQSNHIWMSVRERLVEKIQSLNFSIFERPKIREIANKNTSFDQKSSPRAHTPLNGANGT